MKSGHIILLSLFFILPVFFYIPGCYLGQSFLEHTEVTILSYNVENLFDDVDNGTEYNKYDPGAGQWTTELFHIKLIHIAEVIKASTYLGPDILAFQEVENQNALLQLKNNYLEGMGYRYDLFIPTEGAAVNLALLSRFPIDNVHTHCFDLQTTYSPRYIIEVQINCRGKSLIIFNNHWKSKLGGAEETEFQRLEAAALIARKLREIHIEQPYADIVVLGDLNENVDEYIRIAGKYQTALIPAEEPAPENYGSKSLFITMTPDNTGVHGIRVVLYSSWNDSNHEGSYVYGDLWETIDHMLISAGLFDSSGLVYNSFEVVKKDFMLNDDGFPLRWNTDLACGYSDHLPLLLTLSFE